MNRNMNMKPTTCSKIGIKKKEPMQQQEQQRPNYHKQNNNNMFLQQQQQQQNSLVVSQNQSSNNDTVRDNSIKINHMNPFDNLDLDLNNYKFDDIKRLFDIEDSNLTDEIMKTAKRKVLKLHPDKCKMKLDPKIYEFFQKAYSYLDSVYQFQNRSENRENRNGKYSSSDIHDEDNSALLKEYFEKQGGFSNEHFNKQFEQYAPKDEHNQGYNEWFKSDENMFEKPQEKISKNNMNAYIEKQKQKLCEITPYKGVSDMYVGTAIGGALLDMSSTNNFTGSTSGDLFSNRGLVFTDLKQAYTETLIPVSEADFHNKKQYKNVNEYSAMREQDANSYKRMSKAESEVYIKEQEKKQGMEAASVAFQLAKQAEKAKEKTNDFWSSIRQITYGGENTTSNGIVLLK